MSQNPYEAPQTVPLKRQDADPLWARVFVAIVGMVLAVASIIMSMVFSARN